MALDFADNLTQNKDIVFVRSDKYRAYNLLQNASVFEDNEGIGLDVAGMIEQGLDDDQIESLITQYLIDFACDLNGAQIRSAKGTVSVNYNFGGSYVQS